MQKHSMRSIAAKAATLLVIGSASLLTACVSQPSAGNQFTANALRVASTAAPISLGSAPAPTGFLDFCARIPEQCGLATPRSPAETSNLKRALYRAYYWGSLGLRGSQNLAPASLGTASSEQTLAEPPAATAAEIQTDPSWTSAGRVTRIIWTPEIQSFLEGMNRRVNMAVHQRSDEQQYGRADYWAAPLLEHTNGYGDCEDVVLEKRAALLQDGLPVGAMSIALVKTPWGDTHAVLLISTDKGDLTLDSLSPWVRSFETTGYSFLLKQKAGSTFAWERFA